GERASFSEPHRLAERGSSRPQRRGQRLADDYGAAAVDLLLREIAPGAQRNAERLEVPARNRVDDGRLAGRRGAVERAGRDRLGDRVTHVEGRTVVDRSDQARPLGHTGGKLPREG